MGDKIMGELCEDCPNRTMILESCHDLNNALALPISGTATMEEVVYNARIAKGLVHKLMSLGKEGFQVGKQPIISVADVVERLRASQDLYGSIGWEHLLHVVGVEGIADRKIVGASLEDEATIAQNMMANWQKAGVTKIHTIVQPFNDTGLLIEIIDNGCGMDRLQLEKIQTGVPDGDHGTGCQIIKRLFAKAGKTITWDSLQYVGTRITIRAYFVD